MQDVAVAIIGVYIPKLSTSFAKIDLPECADEPRFGAATFDHRISPKCITLMRSANSSATSMSYSIITMVTSRGIGRKQFLGCRGAPPATDPAKVRRAEQAADFARAPSRSRPGALAIGFSDKGRIDEMRKADALQRRPCAHGNEVMLPVEAADQSIPAQRSTAPAAKSITLRMIVSCGNNVMIW